jgi:hypothetical protein
LQDPYKQVQYSDVLKTLQEEHRLLQDMEAALEEIKSGPPSTSSRTPTSLVSCGGGVLWLGALLVRRRWLANWQHAMHAQQVAVKCWCWSACADAPALLPLATAGRPIPAPRQL